MRVFAYVLISIGIFMIGVAIDSERRGVAFAAAPTETSIVQTARRDDNLQEFRNLMNYQWWEAGATLLLGVITLLLVRRADTLDPFSNTFAGKVAIDELEEVLNRDEQRKKNPPSL